MQNAEIDLKLSKKEICFNFFHKFQIQTKNLNINFVIITSHKFGCLAQRFSDINP